tara:strand:- start:39217 stop:40266 length:1050 start_codon:yes stop_codon:yes gene_type:complete
MKSIKIQNKIIGEGNPCFIVAEIGINHGGNLKLAFKMIDAAKKSGADAVKFQNYQTDDFIRDKKIKYTYYSKGKKNTVTQYEMFKKFELSSENLKKIKLYCLKKQIIFFSTPTGFETLNQLRKLKVPIIKNGSDLLTNVKLIELMGKTKIPTVISCGMSSLKEISDAVKYFKKGGGKDLILLHCTSSYPAPVAEINLKRIQYLKKKFKILVGFSDHSEGILAATAAVTLGACMIEKHFTVSKNLTGPDHRFSSDPNEFSELVQAIRYIEKANGIGQISPTKSEIYGRKYFRLSCVASRNLKKGTIIKDDDISFSRPGNGLAPKNKTRLIGKQIKISVKKDTQILLKHIN